MAEQPTADQVTMLTELLARGDPDLDEPAARGALGEAWLQRYAENEDESALAAALGCLTEAAGSAPGHDDEARWWFWLGVAYGERASRRRSLAHLDAALADYGEAIGWLTRVLDADLDDPADHDLALVAWMELVWIRFHLLRSGEQADTTDLRGAAERLVGTLTSRTLRGENPDLVNGARMFIGLGLHARYQLTERRSDLDAGIAELAAATPHLPPDTAGLPEARAELMEALQTKADLDGDGHALDQSIVAGEAAIAAIDDTEPAWPLTNFLQATGYGLRWGDRKDPADLDRAIGRWRVLLADAPDGYASGRCGDLLRERAELSGDVADAAEAVRLLELASQTPDEIDPWLPWYDLAAAYEQHAQLTSAPESWAAALHCLDRALGLGLGVPDADALLTVHIKRVWVASEALSSAAQQPHTEPPAAAAYARRALTEAAEVLDGSTGADLSLRAHLAGLLGLGQLQVAGLDLGPYDLDEVLSRVELARQLPDPPAEWLVLLDAATATARYAIDAASANETGEAGVSGLAKVLASPAIDGEVRAALRQSLSLFLHTRGSRGGDIRSRHAAVELLHGGPSASTMDAAGDTDPEALLIGSVFRAVNHLGSGDFDAFRAVTDQATAALAQLRPSVGSEVSLVPLVGMLRQTAAVLDGRAVDPPDLPPVPVRPTGGGEDVRTAGSLATAVMGFIQASVTSDVAKLREYADWFDRYAAQGQVGHALHGSSAFLAAQAWLDIARLSPFDRWPAQRAAHWYETLLADSRPTHPLRAGLALNLAESLRLAGARDLARSRDLGRSALHGHSMQALLQAGTDYALSAARNVSGDAAKVAGWCVADGAYDELVATLDAGRGLVLRAATSSRDIASQLAAAGHQDLADEWRATGGLGRDRLTGDVLPAVAAVAEVPDDLRDRVLRVLRPSGTAPGDVTVGEVQQALGTVGADALVYLVPSSPEGAGLAVVVPVSGAVEPINLPDLRVDADSFAGRWAVGSARGRDLDPVGPPPPTGLDDLCRWAWTACVGKLVDHVRRWQLPRPARLVLVPMGILGLVPWHAAYRPAGTGRRYAIADLAVSYSVSARMFCAAAAHRVEPIRSALVVGNPGGDLDFAGVEACAVQRAFYPDGAYFGQPAEAARAPGTPADVLGWLAAAPGPRLLHLACHGRGSRQRPADAELILAGDERLAARTLLEASRLDTLDIDRVFLAACTTNAIGDAYDEAFSLSTAFLAAGAHTVFGSLWPVPDADTSLLMFMVHHFLHTGPGEPADALRRAQLWMLDPDRVAPAGMPADLRGVSRLPSLARLVAWAGFTHLGR